MLGLTSVLVGWAIGGAWDALASDGEEDLDPNGVVVAMVIIAVVALVVWGMVSSVRAGAFKKGSAPFQMVKWLETMTLAVLKFATDTLSMVVDPILSILPGGK